MKSPARMLLAAAALALASAAPAQTAPPVTRTVVADPVMLQRLRRNSGITLQWISFESSRRGHVRVTERNGLVHLSGRQLQANGAGRLELDGDVLLIDARTFTFRGRIAIFNAPDPDRECIREGNYEFRISGPRRYWRLRDIEACGGLADYVDIYF